MLFHFIDINLFICKNFSSKLSQYGFFYLYLFSYAAIFSFSLAIIFQTIGTPRVFSKIYVLQNSRYFLPEELIPDPRFFFVHYSQRRRSSLAALLYSLCDLVFIVIGEPVLLSLKCGTLLGAVLLNDIDLSGFVVF